MDVLTKDADGGVTVKLSREDLLTLGAGVWVAKEEGSDRTFSRFFPHGSEGIGEEQFGEKLYELSAALSNLGVDMG